MTDDILREYLEHGPPSGIDGRVPRVRALLGAASTWDEVPVAGSLDAVLARVDTERATGSRSNPPRHRRTASRRLLAVAAAAALLGAGGGLGWLVAQQSAPAPVAQPTVPRGTRIPLAGTDLAPDAIAVAEIRNTPSGFAISLAVSGLPPAPPGAYYEAWVRSPSGQLVAVGTFHLRSDKEPVELWSGVDVARYPLLTVTLQREGAGADSSGQVVLRGTIPAGRGR